MLQTAACASTEPDSNAAMDAMKKNNMDPTAIYIPSQSHFGQGLLFLFTPNVIS